MSQRLLIHVPVKGDCLKTEELEEKDADVLNQNVGQVKMEIQPSTSL